MRKRLPVSMKVAALRAAIVEGEQSGASTRFDFDAFLARKRKKTKPDTKRASSSGTGTK